VRVIRLDYLAETGEEPDLDAVDAIGFLPM
jgi:hypothetical protein